MWGRDRIVGGPLSPARGEREKEKNPSLETTKLLLETVKTALVEAVPR